MKRNPQAVLDVLEFYSENLVSKNTEENFSNTQGLNDGMQNIKISESARIPPRSASAKPMVKETIVKSCLTFLVSK